MKKKRPLKETLVIVGEGPTEVAFINHIKSIYGVGNPKVTAKSAGGKGPSNVIGDAIATLRSSGCDRVASLLDTDIPWPNSKTKEAKSKRIILIGSIPCIEGLLLDILSQAKPTPCNNKTCKDAVHPQLDGRETERLSYQKIFTKGLLDLARLRVCELDDLIKLITGQLK